jgi:hypothetical protein
MLVALTDAVMPLFDTAVPVNDAVAVDGVVHVVEPKQ